MISSGQNSLASSPNWTIRHLSGLRACSLCLTLCCREVGYSDGFYKSYLLLFVH